MTFEQSLLQKHPSLAPCWPDLQKSFEILKDVFRNGGKLLVCGNGGSAADSEHIVGELMKGYMLQRPLSGAEQARLISGFESDGEYLAKHLQGALPAISLVSQTSLLTAFVNDVAADLVFAQQVYGYGKEGDAILAISTSGNSKNVVYALQAARAKGLHTLGLTGGQGGAMAALCDAVLRVPAKTTTDIQEGHMALYHTLCAMLEAEFFAE